MITTAVQYSPALQAGASAFARPSAGGGSPAGASPATSSAAAASGYLYWSNTVGPLLKPGDGMIGRARLDGTDVNQRFVARRDFLNLHGVAAGPGR